MNAHDTVVFQSILTVMLYDTKLEIAAALLDLAEDNAAVTRELRAEAERLGMASCASKAARN